MLNQIVYDMLTVGYTNHLLGRSKTVFSTVEKKNKNQRLLIRRLYDMPSRLIYRSSFNSYHVYLNTVICKQLLRNKVNCLETVSYDVFVTPT